MSDFDPLDLTTRAFRQLRSDGLDVSLGEYLAAVEAVRWELGPKTRDDLKTVLRLLWCHSLAEQRQFEQSWESIAPAGSPPPRPEPSRPSTPLPAPVEPAEKPERSPQPPPESQQPIAPPPQTDSELSPLPVRTPFIPESVEDNSELQTYFPVTRRALSYLWRYLRRPVADGPVDVIDIDATVQQVSRTGFFLAPVYRRREVNHARLVLLIDQEGSMTPFHRFTRDLVETAQEDSTLQAANVSAYYFHNVPATYLYADDHLIQPISLAEVLNSCDSETSVLIVSDAGAARGHRRMERVGATTEFLVQLKQRTSLISWLNPMPSDRWFSTSAEIIAYLVPMEPMDEDGMGNAIDVVRGQVLSF